MWSHVQILSWWALICQNLLKDSFLPVQIESILSLLKINTFLMPVTVLSSLGWNNFWVGAALFGRGGWSGFGGAQFPLWKTILVKVVMNYIHKFKLFFFLREISQTTSTVLVAAALSAVSCWATTEELMQGHLFSLRVFKKLKTHTTNFITSPRSLKNDNSVFA